MGPKKVTSGSKLSSPAKNVPTKAKTAGKTAAQKKGSPAKVGVKVTKGSTSKPGTKGPAKAKITNQAKKGPTKEDIAAIKIQSFFRKCAARNELKKLKQKKVEYNELIEKLQRQAWLDIIQKQREDDERERLKEEEARRRKREELKWRKDILEAAFDGELDRIMEIIKQAEDRTRTSSSLTEEGLERLVRRIRMSFIECEDANGNSVLSEASAGGSLPTIKFFIDNGASVNKQGQFSRTPLFRASFGGHLDAVNVLLQLGGDPRITDNDGVLPEQIAAAPEITECIQNWDVSLTDALLIKAAEEKESRVAEEERVKQIEQQKFDQQVEKLEKEYLSNAKILQKAYEELNKRITEYDLCVADGFDRPDVTVQAIHDAEDHLINAQRNEKETREKLAAFRLQLREQKTADNEDDGTVKCHIKELDDVLLRDVGNKIKDSGRWPLLIDTSEQAVTFLKYRDTNYLNALSPKDMEIETFRLALLGAIRYGKPLVIDMMEINLLSLFETRCNDVQDNLYEELVSKDILQNKRFLTLIRPNDGKDYSKENFVDMRVERFMLLIVTKLADIPKEWMDVFYVIKIITPAMT